MKTVLAILCFSLPVLAAPGTRYECEGNFYKVKAATNPPSLEVVYNGGEVELEPAVVQAGLLGNEIVGRLKETNVYNPQLYALLVSEVQWLQGDKKELRVAAKIAHVSRDNSPLRFTRARQINTLWDVTCKATPTP